MQGLPQQILMENWSINMEFLEDKMGEITARVYLLSTAEIKVRLSPSKKLLCYLLH